MTNLKPCIFCNSSDDLVVRTIRYKSRVICYTCNTEGPYKETPAKALEVWNKAHDKPLSPNLDLVKQQRLELVKSILPALITKDLPLVMGMIADTYSEQNDFVKDGYGRKTDKRKQPREYWYADEAIKYADAVLKKLEEK